MFRFNNPDALLVLLLVVAAYCVGAGDRDGQYPLDLRWRGCVIGFAFLTKMLQAFLVVPGFALAFLVAAPVGLWKRVWQAARRRRRDDRLGRLVHRAGRAVACRLPALHRRLDRQQPAAAGVGLQRD